MADETWHLINLIASQGVEKEISNKYKNKDRKVYKEKITEFLREQDSTAMELYLER